MKSLLPIALAAFVLFGASAAMSVWLYQSKQPDAAPTEPEKAAKKPAKDKDPERAGEKEPAEKTEPKAPAKEKDAGLPKPPESPALADLKSREEHLNRRADFHALVLRDLQAERDAVDNLQRQAVAEMKTAAAQAGETARSADADRKKAEQEATEWKTLRQLAERYEAMSADAAAPIVRQMADSGKLTMAARLLLLMKPRSAAGILGALGDNALATQISTEMLKQKPPGDKVVPAGGPGSP